MKFLDTQLLGNSVADYATSLLLLVLAFAAARLVRHLLHRYLSRLTALTRTRLDDLVVERVLPPAVYLVLLGGAWVAKSHLNIEPTVNQWLDKALLVSSLVIVFWVLARLVNCILEVAAESYAAQLPGADERELEQRRQAAARVHKQVREVTSMLLWLLAILTILSNLGVDLKAIWASLGIGGIALVVAVKEPLANLVGRMYIYGTGIFDEGHFIVFGPWSGTVTKIGLFRTYLELFTDMTTASVPNAQFVTGAVKSYYGRQKFMYKWDLDVPYATPAATVQSLVAALREHILAREEVNPEKCWVYLDRLGAHSKVVRVWFQVSLPDWAASLFYGDGVLHEIQQIFGACGVDFAFPTQTLHVQGARLVAGSSGGPADPMGTPTGPAPNPG